MVHTEFTAPARKATKCALCSSPVNVGDAVYIRQVSRMVHGSMFKTTRPTWQVYHVGKCSLAVGGPETQVLAVNGKFSARYDHTDRRHYVTDLVTGIQFNSGSASDAVNTSKKFAREDAGRR